MNANKPFNYKRASNKDLLATGLSCLLPQTKLPAFVRPKPEFRLALYCCLQSSCITLHQVAFILPPGIGSDQIETEGICMTGLLNHVQVHQCTVQVRGQARCTRLEIRFLIHEMHIMPTRCFGALVGDGNENGGLFVPASHNEAVPVAFRDQLHAKPAAHLHQCFIDKLVCYRGVRRENFTTRKCRQ